MDLVTRAWTALTFRLAVAYEGSCIMPVFERLEVLRANLLSPIPPTTTAVLEIGPGAGFNIRHYPKSVANLTALLPAGDHVHDRVLSEASKRDMHVEPITYVTLAEALARGLLTETDASAAKRTAARVAAALGVAWDADNNGKWVVPRATGSVGTAVSTLVQCTVAERDLPWLLAEIARVLDPVEGRFLFLEHVPTRGTAVTWGPRAWMWRVLRRAHAAVFGGCDIGRARMVVGISAALEVEVAEWEDGRWWAGWIFGKFVLGSGRVPRQVVE